MKSDTKLDKQLSDLVIARLTAIPKNLSIAIGSDSFTVEELIKSVKEGDKVGEQITKMQIDYLKDLSSCKIYEYLNDQ
jgi:hypothetical protein